MPGGGELRAGAAGARGNQQIDLLFTQYKAKKNLVKPGEVLISTGKASPCKIQRNPTFQICNQEGRGNGIPLLAPRRLHARTDRSTPLQLFEYMTRSHIHRLTSRLLLENRTNACCRALRCRGSWIQVCPSALGGLISAVF